MTVHGRRKRLASEKASSWVLSPISLAATKAKLLKTASQFMVTVYQIGVERPIGTRRKRLSWHACFYCAGAGSTDGGGGALFCMYSSITRRTLVSFGTTEISMRRFC